MKTTKQTLLSLAILGFAGLLHAQSSFQILSTTAKDDGIQIKWESESNCVYRIEYATELVDGSTAWDVLALPRFGGQGVNA